MFLGPLVCFSLKISFFFPGMSVWPCSFPVAVSPHDTGI